MGANKPSRKSRNLHSGGQLVFIITSIVFQITGVYFNATEIKKNLSVVTAVEEAATLHGGGQL